MKLVKLGILAGLLVASANAATVGVSPGFVGGVFVTTDSVQSASTLEIGGWDGVTFTPFGASTDLAAGAKVAGSFSASGPVELNSDPVFFRVTSPAGGLAILSTPGTFPADVSNALQSATITFSNSTGFAVASGDASFTDANTLNLVAIPEPSIALLGGLGLIGLLRRRR